MYFLKVWHCKKLKNNCFSIYLKFRFLYLAQRFSNHGSRPKSGSPRLRGWVAKPYQLPHVKEKDLRIQDCKSEDPYLKEHYDFKTKIQKSKPESR